MMRHSAIFLMLFLSPEVLLPQADHFPLNVGNTWTYHYWIKEHFQLQSLIQEDSGIAQYTVIEKTEGSDSILWTFREIVNAIRLNSSYIGPGGITQKSHVADTADFSIIEYRKSNHRVCYYFWNWRNVLSLGYVYADSVRIERYIDSAADTVARHFELHYPDRPAADPIITLTTQRDVGIITSQYREKYYPGYVRDSYHQLLRSNVLSVGGAVPRIPEQDELFQNYPNPFNPVTTITFSLAERAFVMLVMYDALGREVERLEEGELDAGHHMRIWNAATQPSGVYFYRLTTGKYSETKKLLLLR